MQNCQGERVGVKKQLSDEKASWKASTSVTVFAGSSHDGIIMIRYNADEASLAKIPAQMGIHGERPTDAAGFSESFQHHYFLRS